jgi:hypothetical protein
MIPKFSKQGLEPTPHATVQRVHQKIIRINLSLSLSLYIKHYKRCLLETAFPSILVLFLSDSGSKPKEINGFPTILPSLVVSVPVFVFPPNTGWGFHFPQSQQPISVPVNLQANAIRLAVNGFTTLHILFTPLPVPS